MSDDGTIDLDQCTPREMLQKALASPMVDEAETMVVIARRADGKMVCFWNGEPRADTVMAMAGLAMETACPPLKDLVQEIRAGMMPTVGPPQ